MAKSPKLQRQLQRVGVASGNQYFRATVKRINPQDANFIDIQYAETENSLGLPSTVPYDAGCPTATGSQVIIAFNKQQRRYTATGADSEGIAFSNNVVVVNPNDPNYQMAVPPILPKLRVMPVSDTGLKVHIGVGTNAIFNRHQTSQALPGFNYEYDLATDQPAGGQAVYAVIGINYDLDTIKVAVSDAYSLNAPLTVDIVRQAERRLEAGATQLAHVVLTGGLTDITQDDIIDVRTFVNTEWLDDMHSQPDVVARPTLVPADRHVIMWGAVTVTGTLQVDGRLVIV